MKFYIGLPETDHAWAFERSMFSIVGLWNKTDPFVVNKWILDSGGYTQIGKHGRYLMTPKWYAWRINRLKSNGHLTAAVIQDWQCRPQYLAKTGKTIEEHQELSVQSYIDLRPLTDVTIMPVLQGHYARDYVMHLKAYGNLIEKGTWVGIGGIVGRQQGMILKILEAVKSERSDLRIHAFGLTYMSLLYESIVRLCYSTDSISWCMNARWRNRNSWRFNGNNPADEHDPRYALKFAHKAEKIKGIEKIIHGIRAGLNGQRQPLSISAREVSKKIFGY